MLRAHRIIEGAYYAMDQAGQLLNDAFALYQSKRWASSLVLAVFSLEELGKAETLLSRANDAAIDGHPRTTQEVMAGLRTHPTKLRAGRGPLTITATVSFWSTGSADIPGRGTLEEQEIDRRLAEAERIAQQNAPRDDHRARLRALYVDLGDGELWQKPVETTDDDAYLMLSAASIQYGVSREKFVNPTDEFVRAAKISLEHILPELPTAPDIDWPD